MTTKTFDSYVVRLVAGSHLYGCSVPTSDTDYKSVALPGAREILLQKAFGSVVNSTNADRNGSKNSADDVDSEIHSLHRYLNLVMEGQTIALDMIFTPPQFILEKSPVWDLLVKYRHKFISKNATSFVGYCQAQANKYSVKGYRLNAARRIVEFLEDRMKVDSHARHLKLIEFKSELEELVENYQNDQRQIENGEPECMRFVTISGKGVKPDEPHLEVCGRLTPLHNPLSKAHEVYRRVYDNYGRRAQMAETHQGDYKALYHAVRVSCEALELLTTGHITLPRPEAALLLKIRKGEIPYQETSDLVHQGLVDIEEALKTTTLPAQPDREFADDLICHVYAELVRKEYKHDKTRNSHQFVGLLDG